MSRLHWLVLAFGVTAFASFALVGCGEDEATRCETNDDCAENEICVNGTCGQVCFDADDCDNPEHSCSGACPEAEQPICFLDCKSDEDCPEGQICNTEFCDGKFGRCELPRAEQCASNADCGEGEFCNLVTNECEPKCTSNDDCGDGFLCNTNTGICVAAGASCGDDDDCGDGEVCRSGQCVPDVADNSCDDTSECYDLGDYYCGVVGGSQECVGIACGSVFNDCSRCTLGANNGTKQANAPVIFFPEQVAVGSGQNCQPNSNMCGGEGARLFCKFSFEYFDPNNDFTPSNNNVFVVSGKGGYSNAFAVRALGGNRAEFGACFPDGVNTPGTAIFVRDAAGNASNTLCVIGTR